jgi:hypothetical protein
MCVRDSWVHFLIQAQLCRVILDPKAEASSGQLPRGLQTNQLHQVLALRGLLAGAVLAHVLQKRHLVDYGVNRWVVGRSAVNV